MLLLHGIPLLPLFLWLLTLPRPGGWEMRIERVRQKYFYLSPAASPSLGSCALAPGPHIWVLSQIVRGLNTVLLSDSGDAPGVISSPSLHPATPITA